jgi:hypothetical protein
MKVETLPIETLRPYPRNARTHSRKQVRQIADSILKFGFCRQDNDGEFDNARQKISELLAREQRTWKAFVDSLFSSSSSAWCDWHDPADCRRQDTRSHRSIYSLLPLGIAGK